MAPLTPEEAERAIEELRAEVAQMRQDERRAWGYVIAFLRSLIRGSSQQVVGARDTCEELERLREVG